MFCLFSCGTLRPNFGCQSSWQCTLGCLQIQISQKDPRKDWKDRRKGWLSCHYFISFRIILCIAICNRCRYWLLVWIRYYEKIRNIWIMANYHLCEIVLNLNFKILKRSIPRLFADLFVQSLLLVWLFQSWGWQGSRFPLGSSRRSLEVVGWKDEESTR